MVGGKAREVIGDGDQSINLHLCSRTVCFSAIGGGSGQERNKRI